MRQTSLSFNILLVLCWVALLLTLSSAEIVDLKYSHKIPLPTNVFNHTFPSDFKFGVSTSSYQVEGGWLEGGKGFSVWDVYSHTPGMIANGDTGDIANDMYHKYPEDIQLMKAMGIKNYRFSIAWNRILPTGILPINQEGIDYYNDLINQLLANDIEPHITLYHSETPAALTFYPYITNPMMDSVNFPIWFSTYANVLFEEFGDRVKNWFTFNEPWCSAVLGIDGNKDPYTIAHNILLAHSEAVAIYREKYQTQQKGQIGIVLNTAHFYPQDPNNNDDITAAQRQYDFSYGWFLDPLVKGSYPQSMIDTVGERLPKFTDEQIKKVKGSIDFVALNYYFPFLSSPGTAQITDDPSYYKDENVTSIYDPSWPLSQTGWGIYGPGLRDLLLYTHVTYPGLAMMITENGVAIQEDTVEYAVDDVIRQQYLHDHIEAVGQALSAGAPVKGYFHWSFQDNLEWGSGFQMHFGLTWISRPSLQRIVKDSFRYYSDIIKAASSH